MTIQYPLGASACSRGKSSLKLAGVVAKTDRAFTVLIGLPPYLFDGERDAIHDQHNLRVMAERAVVYVFARQH